MQSGSQGADVIRAVKLAETHTHTWLNMATDQKSFKEMATHWVVPNDEAVHANEREREKNKKLRKLSSSFVFAFSEMKFTAKKKLSIYALISGLFFLLLTIVSLSLSRFCWQENFNETYRPTTERDIDCQGPTWKAFTCVFANHIR